MNPETALPLAFWTPPAGALPIALSGRRGALCELLSLLTSALLFASITALAPAVLEGARPDLWFRCALSSARLRQTWRQKESGRHH
jgi:hypothetical protein